MFTRLKVLTARIRAFFDAPTLDHDLGQELDSHLAMATEDNIRRGMPPDQALREARLRLGGLPQLGEAHREHRGLPALDMTLQDLRYACRTLRRETAFTIFAILIAVLGIGASSTIFSVVNALVFR